MKSQSKVFSRASYEEHIRQELAERGKTRPEGPEEIRRHAEAALASLDELELEYLKTSDPVCVWSAIVQIDFAARVLNQEVSLPRWVLAYLIGAASQIMGRAVGYPAGNRHCPKKPNRNSGRGRTHYSDFFAGLKAPQRRDVLLEALGFMGQGKNVLEDARRALDRADRANQVQAYRRQGLSIKDAAAKVYAGTAEPESGDPYEKFDRDRRKLKPV
jgi:hypothetical protein